MQYILVEKRKPSRINGKINHDIEHWCGTYCYLYNLYTVSHQIFTNYRLKWYKEPDVKNSPKIIPADLRLTWQTAAIWMCDDGSNHGNDIIKGKNYSPRYLILHTESFTENEVEFLISKLKSDLDIKATMNYHDGKPTIRIGSDDWYKFIENIKPYIPWSCFQYKCVNRKKINKNTSGHVGIRFRPNHNIWESYKCFRVNGKFKQIHIGSFSTSEEALQAREQWLIENANYRNSI